MTQKQILIFRLIFFYDERYHSSKYSLVSYLRAFFFSFLGFLRRVREGFSGESYHLISCSTVIYCTIFKYRDVS